jgi:hypothetical protein
MNTLETIILDQHRMVMDAGDNPREALDEAQSAILEAATPEETAELIDYKQTQIEREHSSSRAMMRAQMYSDSVTMRSSAAPRVANFLARDKGLLVPRQGYVGGILDNYGEPLVFGDSMQRNRINQDDPIQEAMGDTFYPPMMWVKALRAATYENRPESARFFSVAEYVSRLGLSLGSMITEYGDVVGATGFMPSEQLVAGPWLNEEVMQHIASEPVEAFRLSGLCDQAVVDPMILTHTDEFAEQVLEWGGSLN